MTVVDWADESYVPTRWENDVEEYDLANSSRHDLDRHDHGARAGPSLAQEWTAFGIRKAGFIFDVPPSFSLDNIAEDSQAAAFFGPRGATLVVRGDHLSGGSFKQNVEALMANDEGAGWQVTYRRVTNTWASYSGVREGTIRYVRSIITCDDRIATFQIDYRQSEKLGYDPVVVRMVESLDPQGC